MRRAVWLEWRKMRRSRVTMTAAVLMVIGLPLMGLGFYSVAVNGGSGPLAAKAGALIVGEGWAGYFSTVGQIVAVAVFLGTGVVVAWIFGREHTDRTFPSLFAMSVTREVISGAKFVVMVLWFAGLSVSIPLASLVIGLAAGVGRWDWAEVASRLGLLLAISFLACLLSSTMAYVASVWRGYLPAIGAIIVIIAIAQVMVLFGSGGWFPFAVPGLLSAGSDPSVPPVTPVQIALVPALAGVGAWLTVAWWRRSEVV